MNDRQIDQVLVERAQKGDHKAFEMLMSKYQRRLNRLISRFIQDEHEVHDVTQEAMIRLIVRWLIFEVRVHFIHGCTVSVSIQQRTS